MLDEASTLLDVQDLATGYGTKRVLDAVALRVARGEIVALIGHNGAGKSTLLKAIFGLLPIWGGRICLNGQPVRDSSPRSLHAAGAAYVPQGNRVFGNLSVKENLEIGGIALASGSARRRAIKAAVELFPVLAGRLHQRARTLSGGEQQMLALASALVLSPRLLLLDEPSLGLSPQMVSEALNRIRMISHGSGTAILIVEQKVHEVLRIAQRVYVLRNGRVVFSGPARELKDKDKLRDVYL